MKTLKKLIYSIIEVTLKTIMWLSFLYCAAVVIGLGLKTAGIGGTTIKAETVNVTKK